MDEQGLFTWRPRSTERPILWIYDSVAHWGSLEVTNQSFIYKVDIIGYAKDVGNLVFEHQDQVELSTKAL